MEASSPLARFLHWEKQKPSGLFLNQPINGGKKTWTYQEAGIEIRKMASAIKALGYPDRSNIAILSKNCAHWVMADLAIMMTGHVSVPLYATLTAPSIKQILDHSESKAIIIGKLDEYATQQEGISSGIARIGVEMYGVRESLSWEKLVQANAPIETIYHWGKDDLMTIMYTSGTTGMPKGVMHTAGNFDVVLRAAIEELGLPLEPSLFSYLPMSHIAERMGIEVYGFYSGAQFSFAESLDTFPKNLFETQPHSFFAVPRIC